MKIHISNITMTELAILLSLKPSFSLTFMLSIIYWYVIAISIHDLLEGIIHSTCKFAVSRKFWLRYERNGMWQGCAHYKKKKKPDPCSTRWDQLTTDPVSGLKFCNFIGCSLMTIDRTESIVIKLNRFRSVYNWKWLEMGNFPGNW